jgi:N-acetyl-gamma-glutamyl-phosphate reductase
MKAVIIGATGYGSAELIRLLYHHPHAEIGGLISSSQAGGELKEVFPHLSHLTFALEEMDPDRIAEMGEVVFFAAPAGVSSEWLPRLAEKGLTCIDLAGDFRLEPKAYAEWYGKTPPPSPWLEQAVYGLSEWRRQEIARADVIANPGCYPTAALLVLIPLLRSGAVDMETVVIDAKSGVSGAGRGLKLTTLFCEVNENLSLYKVGTHQHTPEIEQHAASLSGRSLRVMFTPQLVPMNRGILVTVYARGVEGWNQERLTEIFQEAYKDATFVRIKEPGSWPRTKDVQGSNFCDVGVYWDGRTDTVVGMAVIDNLMKGAAGQAVQNLNLRMAWPETAGLTGTPLYP